MKRLLNTLYVTTEGAWVRKDGANVVVEIDGREAARVPIHGLGGLVCMGRVGVSPPLLGFCCEEGVTISFLSPGGRFLARCEGPQAGNVLLRRAQHAATLSKDRTLDVAVGIVSAKIANQRVLLRRALRDGLANPVATDAVADAADSLKRAVQRALNASTVDGVRGIEGDAAARYFATFCHLIRSDDTAFAFGGRSRRPPRDPVNALLSFLYVLLQHDCRGACETAGLDPQMGFLHRDRPGRASLALDLMEEFRSILAERVALSLINRGQLSGKDFETEPGGAVRMTDVARKTVIVAYQDRKRVATTHPFLGEKMPYGLALLIQAQLLARYLRDELDGYPPFVWR